MRAGRHAIFLYSTLAALFTFGVTDADAQDPVGVAKFAVDVRGAIPIYGQNEEVALGRNLSPLQLSSRGLGLDVGIHVYPISWKAITFGVGVQAMVSRGEKAPEVEVTPVDEDLEEILDLLVIRTTFATIAPQLSFNFGGVTGWSYISGGLGSSIFSVGPVEDERDDRRFSTINYGGGGRWFAKDRLAFALDLRFYAISPQPGTETEPPLPRMTLMVFSVGVSFK